MMRATGLVLVAIVAGLAAASASTARSGGFEPPFSRTIKKGDTGRDVIVFINFIARDAAVKAKLDLSSDRFDDQAVTATKQFQQAHGIKPTGEADADTTSLALKLHSEDGYKDDGATPASLGYKYKVLLPVHRNRSMETTAKLLAANGTTIFTFQARAHGWNSFDKPMPWPDFTDDDVGLNQFSSDGNTPTGLIEFDLNTPEDNATLYGPYDVNRAVQGIKGNAAFLIPNVRDGILLHTGQWPGWQPGQHMPNSEGCIHAYPSAIDTIAKLLKSIGVVAHQNTNGKLPYPYKCQGLLSVYLVD